MMIHTPTSIYLDAPVTLRRNIASLLHGLAERLAPDLNYPSPATSR